MKPRDEQTSAVRPPPGRRSIASVVVATDFSAGAALALGRAGRLPLAQGGRICVVHALPERIPAGALASVEAAARTQLAVAVDVVIAAAAAAGRADLAVSSELRWGKAAVEILQAATATAAELVVLGRHGRSRVRDLFIGSTAARVVRTLPLPVLVVSKRATRAYRAPLVAVDLEDASRATIDHALRVLGADVTTAAMVHAYQVPFDDFAAPLVPASQKKEFRNEARQLAAAALPAFLATLGDVGVQWDASIVQGDARSAIVKEAARRKSDVVVVGTQGRTGLSYAVLGSVSEWVVQAAPCDVLVVRRGP